MENSTSTSQFSLTPPEQLQAVPTNAAVEIVPLEPALLAQVNSQANNYVNVLLSEDIHSDSFKAKLDSAFRLGREEISNAAALMGGRFMQNNFVGMEDSPAFKAIKEMRHQLDELSPGSHGDLLKPRKLLGLIPFGNRLRDYFRTYQEAGAHLQAILADIYAARDDMQRDLIELEQTRRNLWEAMKKLKAAIAFAEQLDAQLADRVLTLESTDPQRAKALQQEVLFYARQNLLDMQTQMTVNVNAYLSMDVLKKTAREMINGCNRVATTGMSALATAQTVARATGNQIAVMDMLTGVNATIGNLINETSQQLNSHVQRTGEYAANPLIGLQVLQESLDTTYQAMDAMDQFRVKAIDAMGKNNATLKGLLEKSEQYLNRSREQTSSTSTAAPSPLDGPVKL